MSEVVAYTVPTLFDKYSNVIGMESASTRLCIPSTFVKHNICTGYNPNEVQQLRLPFQPDISARLITFFGSVILPALKYSFYEPDGKYEPAFNCFSFALMLSGSSKKEYVSPSEAQFIAEEEIIDQGVKIEPSSLKAGQVAVLGSRNSGARPIAYHALIGLDGASGLQVMGPEGSLVVAPHMSVLHFYESLFRVRSVDPTIDYGFFTPPSAT